MGDRKNTTTFWTGPFIGLPFSGPAAQGSAIVALTGSGVDHLVCVGRSSAASRTIPAGFKYSLSRDKTGMPGY